MVEITSRPGVPGAAPVWRPAAADLQPQDLRRAHALPAAFYTEPAALALEQRQLFSRHWQLLAHTGQLAQPGDHVVAEVAGVPLVLVRDEEHHLRALHNVCRHRAGPLALCNGRGARALRCRYHGWTYTLSGVLRSAPEMHDAEDFEPNRVRLPQAMLSTWRQLVFVALDKPVAPLNEVLHGIDERLGGRRLEHYTFHRRVSYDVACNWKVYVDNFLEGYHLPHVHPGLNRLLDYRSYLTETRRWYSLQWSPLEHADGANGNFYGSGEALYYFIFPNIMLNILPDRLQTNQVIPLGTDRCRVEFDYYYPTQRLHDEHTEQDLAFSDEVQQEDIAICEAVQRNLASASYQPGRINPKRESGVHHFHELIREAYRHAQNS